MPYRRVIVVGFDGLEPSLCESLIAAGELPHFQQLRMDGGYRRLGTTMPAQTPVAWSTFATGVNPGSHSIFDFVGRNPETYRPTYGLNHYEQKNPFMPPRAVNDRQGVTVWERLSDRGIPSVVLRCPCTYPAEEFSGKLLAGMGVPDVRGSLGTSSFLTTQDAVPTGESESVIHIETQGQGRADARLLGPIHPRTRKNAEAKLALTIDSDSVTVATADGKERVKLHAGAWSDWMEVRFSLGMLQSMHGMVRFYLRSCQPEIQLVASPINFVPEDPPFPISWPHDYASQLANKVGRFYTTGMVEEHGALSNGRIDKAAFLDQCEQAWKEREAMLFEELQSQSEGFLFCLFDTPDRVQHMFWNDHRSDPRSEWSRVIADQYRRCDALLKSVREAIDDETLLIVLSDHGFGEFDRSVHLNTWLHDQGLLCLKRGVAVGEEAGDMLEHVDWGQTKAYALGLSGIYLNRAGREAEGIVSDDDEQEVMRQICDGLGGLRDDATGKVGVRRAVPCGQEYSGPYVDKAPDVLVNYERGFRASWETALGGVPQGWFADNTRAWSGDHIVDPCLVPGVLFTNRPIRESSSKKRDPHLVDLAPTILSACGVEPDAQLEGENLLV